MTSETRKVVVHLRATGDAPILKQSKFKMTGTDKFVKIAGTDKFVKVIDFLRRQLHRDTLFVYVNSAFSPNPDELVSDLCDNVEEPYHLFYAKNKLSICMNFGIDGKLVVNYACSMAWG